MKVELPGETHRRLQRHLWKAGSREIGGVLMGEQFKPGHFRIVDFSVDDCTGSAAHFVRSTAEHQAALADFFGRTGADYGRFNYLGEWHSHPSFAAVPSVQDARSMTSLVETEEHIPFSVLLIVRTRWRYMLDCSATLFQRGGFRSEVEIVR
jgi:integrative and conjugative element protein (TIGR02256 family)